MIIKPPKFAIYERVPTHTNKPDSVILGDYNTIEEAQKDREKYGYNNDNYYIGYEKIN